jgi:hypothetical protein
MFIYAANAPAQQRAYYTQCRVVIAVSAVVEQLAGIQRNS